MNFRDKISTNQLQVGMYICRLDRPWLDTPFPFQGFYLRTTHEIKDVQRFCEHVYIDSKKGSQPYKESEISKPSPLLANNNKAKSKLVKSADLKKVAFHLGKYDKGTKSFKKEINNAQTLFIDLAHSIEQINFNIRVGKNINVAETKALTKSVVGSVIKNPNTMIWLSRLKDQGDYTYNHSLRASVLATVFGRYLGLSEDELISLATGVLLSDIGKTKINRSLLNKSSGFTTSEKILLRSHVELGVEMLASEKNIDHTTLVIVETHHERIDGSGYPYALVGNEIPLFGQIAGLVDVFDAITHQKSYGEYLTTAQAMDWLYLQRDKLFSGKLVDDFVQAIGLYPAGTIVELTDESIGLVISHNPDKRLRPEIFLLKNSQQQTVLSTKTIDLSKRAFMSKVDRPMIKNAILPENLNLTGEKIVVAIQSNKKVKKALFG
ncbi:MAG: HD-GYP domain-containing protein [Proteobacteria bacterium]|nr:HD-GYP domain-containing protein [Pseudomonadota bacterium]